MIRTTMIVEIAGTPANHVKTSLGEYMLNLNHMKEVDVHSIKISEPNQIPDSPNMFTCFAEADFSTHSIIQLSEIIFDFMPSSVEITDPTQITIDNLQATELFNQISGRMHRYDDVAKASYAKIQQLTRLLEQKQAGTTNQTQAKPQTKPKATKKTSKKPPAKKKLTKKKASKKKK